MASTSSDRSTTAIEQSVSQAVRGPIHAIPLSKHDDEKIPHNASWIMPPIVLAASVPIIGPLPATLLAALTFEFVNGFHDASNAVAPLVKSHTLSYRPAVWWSTICTLAPVAFIGAAAAKVAHTIGAGLFDAGTLVPSVMFAGVTAGFSWSLATWRYGIPSSSSHALLGGLGGAAMAAAYTNGTPVLGQFLAPGWAMIGTFMVAAPAAAGLAAYALTKSAPHLKAAVQHGRQKLARIIPSLAPKHGAHANAPEPEIWPPPRPPALASDATRAQKLRHSFNEFSLDAAEMGRALITPAKWPMLGAAALLNFGHSKNDAQKAMPIVAGSLYGDPTAITPTVQWMCYLTMTMGTFLGGKRITQKLVNGLGHQHDKMVGFSTSAVTAGILEIANDFKVPASTSQITGGATIGANAGIARKNVKWDTARKMAFTWVATPLISGLMAAAVFKAVDLTGEFNKTSTTVPSIMQEKSPGPAMKQHKGSDHFWTPREHALV